MSHNLDNTPKFAGRSSVDWAVKQKLLVGDNRGNWKLNNNLTKQEAIEKSSEEWFRTHIYNKLNEKLELLDQKKYHTVLFFKIHMFLNGQMLL